MGQGIRGAKGWTHVFATDGTRAGPRVAPAGTCACGAVDLAVWLAERQSGHVSQVGGGGRVVRERRRAGRADGAKRAWSGKVIELRGRAQHGFKRIETVVRDLWRQATEVRL